MDAGWPLHASWRWVLRGLSNGEHARTRLGSPGQVGCRSDSGTLYMSLCPFVQLRLMDDCLDMLLDTFAEVYDSYIPGCQNHLPPARKDHQGASLLPSGPHSFPLYR